MKVQMSNIRRVQSGRKACRLLIGFALANVSEYGPGSEIWGRGVFPFTKSAGLLTPYCLLWTSEGATAAKRRLDPVLKSIANRDLANRALTIGSSVAEYAILGLAAVPESQRLTAHYFIASSSVPRLSLSDRAKGQASGT